MANLIFPQTNTFGGLWTGLDATPTGSDPANDVVADFTGSAQTLFTAPSQNVPVIAAHSQTLGSTFKIAREGMWVVSAAVQHSTASSVLAAVGIDNIAAELNADPGIESTRILRRMLSTQVGADFTVLSLVTAPFAVTDAMARSVTAGFIRLLLSNAAGAGAAAASLAPLANGVIRIQRICSLGSRQRHGRN